MERWAENADVWDNWYKEKCKEIIQTVEALPLGGLTWTEKQTHLKAIDEYDYTLIGCHGKIQPIKKDMIMYPDSMRK